jgi:hypothetical protein
MSPRGPMVLAIAHSMGGIEVLDVIREVRPQFSSIPRTSRRSSRAYCSKIRTLTGEG